MAQNAHTPPYVLALDHGTSGCKVALVSVHGEVRDFAFEPTPTLFLPDGGAEQDPEQWWNAFVAATRKLLSRITIPVESIEAICVSSTYSSTVAVDKSGKALMNCLTWLDSRGAPYVREVVSGFPSVLGYGIGKLLKWIRLTSGIPQLSGKDDIAHMLLVQRAFPEVYEKTAKFLGSKDYFNVRLTGNLAASYDSIGLFWITDIRDIDHVHYEDSLIQMLKIDQEKLPELMASTDVLGTLLPGVARELGLPENTKVVMGSPDHQAALVGSGAVRDFEGHCYIGTSSWIECLVPFKRTDPLHSIASIASAIPGRYQCIDEQDIAGGCLSFFVDRILFHQNQLNQKLAPADAYRLMDEVVAAVPAGSHKVIFTPWLNGERTPVDSTTLRGGFYNVSLTTSLDDMTRAIYEGVACNTRWNLSYVEAFIRRPFDALTFIGGGAKSDVWCQIFADVLNRPVKQSVDPILANARGAAFIAAVGLGHIRFDDLPGLVHHRNIFQPNPRNRDLYDELFANYLSIYNKTKGIFARLNRVGEEGRIVGG
ncbi:MAG: FGGY-family carbohydrate kinase [Anaerolineales bacterium]